MLWRKNMVILDANVILRYVLNDNEAMADQAEKYITGKNVVITLEVAAEVVYVLNKVYFMERHVIAHIVKGFAELVECQEMAVLQLALDVYAAHNLDFVDCVLYAYRNIHNIEIATFDKKLLKLLVEG